MISSQQLIISEALIQQEVITPRLSGFEGVLHVDNVVMRSLATLTGFKKVIVY